MTRALAKGATARAFRLVWLLAACSVFLVLVPAPGPRASAAAPSAAANVADDFNRANGALGRNWTGVRDGALSISSHAVTGRGGLAGDIWTAETFAPDQFSQIEVGTKPLAAGQWIGAAVRV